MSTTRPGETAEQAEEEILNATFNTATRFTEELKALQRANPKFNFTEERDADSVTYKTNVPQKPWLADKKANLAALAAGASMEIQISAGDRTGGLITVFRDVSVFPGFGKNYDETRQVGKAINAVKKQLDKKGFTS